MKLIRVRGPRIKPEEVYSVGNGTCGPDEVPGACWAGDLGDGAALSSSQRTNPEPCPWPHMLSVEAPEFTLI